MLVNFHRPEEGVRRPVRREPRRRFRGGLARRRPRGTAGPVPL